MIKFRIEKDFTRIYQVMCSKETEHGLWVYENRREGAPLKFFRRRTANEQYCDTWKGAHRILLEREQEKLKLIMLEYAGQLRTVERVLRMKEGEN